MMKSSFKDERYSLVKAILFAFIMATVCRHFIFSPIAVKGESMLPFEDKDRLVISKVTSINRFDIIVFQAPDQDENYVKRVIGIPGDSVEIKDDVLYINGKAYKEAYVNKNINRTIYNNETDDFNLEDHTSEKTIPEGYYFVLGGNRWKSNDSREFGLISSKSIIGEVKFRYYPLQDIGVPK